MCSRFNSPISVDDTRPSSFQEGVHFDTRLSERLRVKVLPSCRRDGAGESPFDRFESCRLPICDCPDPAGRG